MLLHTGRQLGLNCQGAIPDMLYKVALRAAIRTKLSGYLSLSASMQKYKTFLKNNSL